MFEELVDYEQNVKLEIDPAGKRVAIPIRARSPTLQVGVEIAPFSTLLSTRKYKTMSRGESGGAWVF